MLSNTDLYKMAKDYDVKIDEIIYKDDIMNISKKLNMNIIINLQDSSSEGNGTHWTILIKRNNKYFYFDSFGANCPNIVKQYCQKNLGCNNYIVQNINSETCGYFCFALLLYLKHNKGNNFYDICNDYINLYEDNTKFNDKILFKYINSIPLTTSNRF